MKTTNNNNNIKSKNQEFFTKGKKYRCTKSVVMKKGGETAFKAGSIYEQPTSEADGEAVTEADGIKIGDTVRHNKHEEVATVTAIREAFVNGCDGYRYLYTLDFGQSVTGPFGVELNGGEFLREAFTPCTPDGRDLLPDPPAEIALAV